MIHFRFSVGGRLWQVRALVAAVAALLTGSAAFHVAVATAQGTVGFWAQFRFGPARTGFNPFETELKVSNVKNLKDHTLPLMGGVVEGAPAVVDDIAYAFATDGRLYAFRVSTGKLLWRRSVGGGLDPTNPSVTFGLSSPAVGPGDHPRVFIGTPDGKVVAVRARDGVKMWTSSPGGRIISSPTVVDGVVYIGSNNHSVYAFRASDGKRLWRFATGGKVESSPAVVGETVYVGSDDHKVYALAADDGKKRWSRGIGGSASTPAVSGKVLYVTSGNGKLYALAKATGTVKWSRADESFPTHLPGHAPAVAGGRVFTTAPDTTMRAFNASTGKPIWNTGPLMQGVSDPAVANGVVYVGTTDDKLNAFNASTGKKLFGTTGGRASAYQAPVVEGGTVVVSGNHYVGATTALSELHVYRFKASSRPPHKHHRRGFTG